MTRWLTMRRLRWRDAVVVIFLVVFTTYLLFNGTSNLQTFRILGKKPQALAYLDFDWSAEKNAAPHEIDRLVANAFSTHRLSLTRAIYNSTAGAAAYRQRRGRHPPPGFDKWYAKAIRSDAIVVEDFFDQIYEDLEAFWGIEPNIIRNAVPGWKYTLRVRNGKVLDIPQDRHRSRTWGEMLKKLAPDLPDLDIAINPFDEPRVVAPAAAVDTAHEKSLEQKTRSLSIPLSSIKQHLPPISGTSTQDGSVDLVTYGSAWPVFQQGCRDLDSSSRSLQAGNMLVTNWTASKDVCQDSSLSVLHGALIAPDTLSMAQSLIPIFSGAKFSTNNDILLPAPSYFAEEELFSVKSWLGDPSSRFKWEDKKDELIWRGKATGGSSNENTWRQFHRHRFVSMLNSSNVDTNILEMPELRKGIGGGEADHISQWLGEKTDVAFTDLFCGANRPEDAKCPALNSSYSLHDPVSMADQYRVKYLPDVDGNSLSGRFRAFLLSNSAPIKATIVKEWHDNRLVPWVHFVPVHISFRDLWMVMAYFLGFGKHARHDTQGRNIALAGQQWSERVLRREDMLLYMHRVLLEYARLCQDDRDRLGYVGDLVNEGG